MARFDIADVRRYYDRHTRGFITRGQGGGQGAIHRAVWGPGVAGRADAFHFVEERIADLLATRQAGDLTARRGSSRGGPPLHVVDLGCGVGGSLVYLAGRLPIRGTGITLSGVQARLAVQRIGERGLSDRVACLEGDFTHLPDSIAPADLAFAIESFVHGPSPERFFAECARLVRPGGWLVICDDFRRPTDDPRAARHLDRFCRGWRVNTLLDAEALRASARSAGFVHEATTDLTPWLELRRPRDRALAVLVALAGWLPLARARIAHVMGGTALQTCLVRGWIGYDLVRFRRKG